MRVKQCSSCGPFILFTDYIDGILIIVSIVRKHKKIQIILFYLLSKTVNILEILKNIYFNLFFSLLSRLIFYKTT